MRLYSASAVAAAGAGHLESTVHATKVRAMTKQN